MAAGIFLEIKDCMILRGYRNYNNAWVYYNQVKDSLGKKKHQRITLVEYAEYEGVKLEEIKKALQIK